MRGDFTLDDFVAQMVRVRKLGPVGKVMGTMLGMGGDDEASDDERGGHRAEPDADVGDVSVDDGGGAGETRADRGWAAASDRAGGGGWKRWR